MSCIIYMGYHKVLCFFDMKMMQNAGWTVRHLFQKEKKRKKKKISLNIFDKIKCENG
jgi:hypothetical protein